MSKRLGMVDRQVNLADNVDPNGRVDNENNPMGYAQDAQYFKAGSYNQCRGAPKQNESVARCHGTGHWPTDKANGDYFQVSFSKLKVTGPVSQ